MKHKHEEVAIVLVADAASCENAVMVSLQDASFAGVAMPGPRWSQCLARRAKSPVIFHFWVAGVDGEVPSARIAENCVCEVTCEVKLN